MRWWAVLLALSACNQVLGLDKTVSIGDDPDQDGVPNSDDNCPNVANEDQANRDGDPYGDACDGCPDKKSDNNHDEDGDGHADECDMCPAVPNFDDDFDSDGIADDCDYYPQSPSAKLAFDPFVELGARWETTGGAWQLTGDSVAPEQPLAATDTGLGLPAIALLPGTSWVEIGAVAVERWKNEDRFGIVLEDADTGVEIGRCWIEHDVDGWYLQILVPGQTQTGQTKIATPKPSMQLQLAVQDASTPGLLCKFPTATFTVGLQLLSQPAKLVPRIYSAPTVHVTYFFAAN